jgi:hypothetical protein
MQHKEQQKSNSIFIKKHFLFTPPPPPLTDALHHRGMLSTAGLFDIIFASADHFLIYVI